MARCNSLELLRSPPFSLQDFQQLVSDAFDLPPNDASPRDLHSPFPSLPPLPVSASVEQCPLTLYAPQPSASFDENHPSDRPSRPRTPFQIFKSIRTRASALLRPTPPSPSSPLPPLPLHLSSESTPIPSPRPSTAQTARPSLSSQRTATLPPANLNLSRTRSHPSPKSFLKLSNRNLPPLPPKPDHYSFFDDSDASYPRSQSSLSRTRLRVHTRLPALHKSRSQMPSIFSKKSAVSDLGCAPRSSYYYAQSCTDLSYNIEDPRCPSPFTSPREAPKPPTFEDSDELEVPDYVFERRGSATSENTMSSTRTTSTLAERLSNAFPISWHRPFSSKSRSKLHLSIASSSHSSPSSSSSHSTSYGSPITPLFQAGYSFPPNVEISQVGTGYGVPIDADIHNFSETEAEALAIGRVLTPEEDPFAKPEINVEDTTTPRPLGYNRYSNQGVCIRDLRRGSAQSEVVPRQRYGVDRMYSTPVFSRSLEPDDFPHALVAANYSFPPSCTVHTSLSPISSSSGLPPSPSVRSFRSREEYNLPPSSWSAWSSPVTVESTCLPSTESSNSDVRVADFPLPPPSIAGLPLGCPAELGPRLSYSVPVSPTSPTSPFSGLGLSFASEASSPLAGRGTQLPATPIPVRARRRERESFRSLRSLPPILSAYEPEESELLSRSFADSDRPSSLEERSDGSVHSDNDDFAGEGLDDSCVLGSQFLCSLGLRGLDDHRSSMDSSASASDREASSFSTEEDPIDRSIQDLLSDLMAERQVDKSPEVHSLSDFINKQSSPNTPMPSTSALADSPNTIPSDDTRPPSWARSDSFECEREDWRRNTSRSTAFFSARSSTYSALRGSPDSWGTATGRSSVDLE